MHNRIVGMQVATNKRYAAASGQGFTVSECAKSVEKDFGNIDIIVHSLANGPEVTKPLLETSRKVGVSLSRLVPRWASARLRPGCMSPAAFPAWDPMESWTFPGALGRSCTAPHHCAAVQGYLAALSASAYSFVSMVQRFGPIMNPGGAAISLTYLASERIIPGLASFLIYPI